TCLVRTHRAVGTAIEGRFPCLHPRLDCENAGIVRLRDLDGREADTARPDDDHHILFLRLPEGHDGPVGGGAAASEGSGQRRIEEVEVRPADPRCEDLHQDVLSARLRVRELNDLDGTARLEPNRAHGGALVRSRSRRFVLLASVPGCEMPRNIDQGDRNRKVPEIRAGPAAGDSVAGTGGMWARMRQKPFSLWVIAGGLVYMALSLLYLGLPFAIMGG